MNVSNEAEIIKYRLQQVIKLLEDVAIDSSSEDPLLMLDIKKQFVSLIKDWDLIPLPRTKDTFFLIKKSEINWDNINTIIKRSNDNTVTLNIPFIENKQRKIYYINNKKINK
jgi:hypothetical protein